MAIKTFVKKPIPLQAIQWTGDNEIEIMDFVGQKLCVSKPPSHFENGRSAQHEAYTIEIPTAEGFLKASRFDWIFKGNSSKLGDHFWPVKDDYVEENYEEVK